MIKTCDGQGWHLDPPVLAHLRASGKGWQTRVNVLLREAVEAGRL